MLTIIQTCLTWDQTFWESLATTSDKTLWMADKNMVLM